MDYEVQRCTRRCAISGRDLLPGETIYSVLARENASIVRHDYAVEAWSAPPEGAVSWWKSQLPAAEAKKPAWAPNDVMLQLFDQLEPQPDRQDMRYVLALLLVRRRVMRLEETLEDAQRQETLVLFCPRREMEYRVQVVMPSEARTDEIQTELASLLDANAYSPIQPVSEAATHPTN